MVLKEKYTLNNGIEVPEIAFGTCAHIKENAELDFVITEEDMNTLNEVKEKHNLWWRKASRVIRNIRGIGKRRSDS